MIHGKREETSSISLIWIQFLDFFIIFPFFSEISDNVNFELQSVIKLKPSKKSIPVLYKTNVLETTGLIFINTIMIFGANLKNN